MPVSSHASFDRPAVTTRLWRYIDVPKFAEMISSRALWLTNAEILANDDPYEGLPGPFSFPHRIWRKVEDVPPLFRERIIKQRRRHDPDVCPEKAFRDWFMMEEQTSIMQATGRANYFVNCWHAAKHESVAMWKIYAAPGAGVAIISNGGRIETALANEERKVHLGAVRYTDPDIVEIGLPNGFDPYVLKRTSYSYEQEVRLVHWDTSTFHDALEHAKWNESTMRYDGLIEDPRPLRPGVSLNCDLDVMIEAVVVSPFAPPWYQTLIEGLRDRLGFSFPVHSSNLLQNPLIFE